MRVAKHIAHHLFHSRVVRVAFFGGMGVIIQTFIFEILGVWTGTLSPAVATLVGGECGVLTSFILNNRFSFGGHHAPLWERVLRFHAVVSGSLFIQWLCVFTAEHLTRNIWVLHGAYASGIVIGFVFNYIGYHLFVWHTPKA